MSVLGWLLSGLRSQDKIDDCEYSLERSDKEYIAATKRWVKHNSEAFQAGCPCGKPSEVVTEYDDNIGAVPVQIWSCREHQGASMYSEDSRGVITFNYERSSKCSDCSYNEPPGAKRCGGYGGPIGKPPTHWHCPDREESEV